jgi:DNA-binding response OmpR family regulator
VEVVKSYLCNSGYTVYEAFTGRQALEMFDKVNPALVVLDLMLPDFTGQEVCKTVRKKSRVPIIMLTAKVEEEDILKGLDLGADDYITKPFSPRELVARAAAVLRRTEEDLPLSNAVSFNNDDLVINYTSHEVKKSGELVNLTPNEFKLLMILVKYPKKVFTRDELIAMVMGDDFEGFDRIIDTHIKNLRQKIETNHKNPQYVLTVHGVGYRFGGE